MSNVTIYHNPRCTKSRQTLALLNEQGIEPTVIEYLKTPPDEATIRSPKGERYVEIAAEYSQRVRRNNRAMGSMATRCGGRLAP